VYKEKPLSPYGLGEVLLLRILALRKLKPESNPGVK
jgi:hypothetical protein